jgi:nitrogen-specific signal transduction histidine kinase
VGLVAMDGQGKVEWLNAAATAIFQSKPDPARLGAPAPYVPSRLTDLLHRRLKGTPAAEPVEWQEPQTGRFVSAVTRRLDNDEQSLGAIAIVSDLTQERKLREREEELERAVFWSDLSTALSHEVRNPLVAINTFAQLLPERYDDPEFRDHFSELVTYEIERLNSIVEQISAFAETRHGDITDLNMEIILRKAVERAEKRASELNTKESPTADGNTEKVVRPAQIDLACSSHLSPVQGNAEALIEAVTCLIENALEAVNEAPYPAINVSASAFHGRDSKQLIRINVVDNGSGISRETVEKVFSPFYTTKPRGIGLGLAVAKRTIMDHGGEIKIDSGAKGTSVEIQLPTSPAALATASTPMVATHVM